MTNPRRRLRVVLLLAGLVPVLLVAAYALKVTLMLQANASGRDAFDRGDLDGAAAEFAGTRTLNWFESWVAAFDEGASEHAQGRYAEAITAYRDALEDVPHRDECTVRINLALAHEAVGDAAAESGATEDARSAYQAGIDVLAAGRCPQDSGRGEEQTADAGAVDERLREKLEQNQDQPQQPQDQQPPQQPQQPGDPGESDPRRDRLQEQNDRGADQRHEDQDLYDDEDYTRPDAW
ncbi:hypothetical protein ACFFOS_16630 [Nocardioides kongjuensis]|uniref:Tetratricopeptide (TPR) repeat protein n=1 Tax=Nocardioides kongjuensis TaxID=349522 RepID=A0A852S4I7_9ACTN|nr:hypothetical protein [Nocardioides kongjuensis]NYD33682.1 tetratricopeptide (TPR) repeat protein [Nocardioides kongjuensis]